LINWVAILIINEKVMNTIAYTHTTTHYVLHKLYFHWTYKKSCFTVISCSKLNILLYGSKAIKGQNL